jgi:hypothetical protein
MSRRADGEPPLRAPDRSIDDGEDDRPQLAIGHHRRDEQTPRVSITVRRPALAKRPLGRMELKHSTAWADGQPATELNFKFYRQATNKIVGISDEAATFLRRFFSQPARGQH